MKNQAPSSAKEKIVIYLVSVIMGFVVLFIFMFALAAVGVAVDISESFAAPLASVSLAAGGLSSAFLASRKIGSGGILNGLVCGLSMFLIVSAVALITNDGGLTLSTLLRLVIVLLAAFIGGIWGANWGEKKII